MGSNSGGIPDAIETGVSGFIVPDDDLTALKDTIISLLKDKQLSKNMAKKGRERIIESFTWEQITFKLLDTFQKL